MFNYWRMVIIFTLIYINKKRVNNGRKFFFKLCFHIFHGKFDIPTSWNRLAYSGRPILSSLFLEVHKYRRKNVLLQLHLQWNKESISSTFYVHVFLYESALLSFSLVTFWLWQKDFGKKALSFKNCMRKMLIKLTKA